MVLPRALRQVRAEGRRACAIGCRQRGGAWPGSGGAHYWPRAEGQGSVNRRPLAHAIGRVRQVGRGGGGAPGRGSALDWPPVAGESCDGACAGQGGGGRSELGVRPCRATAVVT